MKKLIFTTLIIFLFLPNAGQAVFSKQLIFNSGFEKPKQLDEWNCKLSSIYAEVDCPIYSFEDDGQKSGEYYFALGTGAIYDVSLNTNITQKVKIPENTSKLRLSFDYKWHSEDADYKGDIFSSTIYGRTTEKEIYREILHLYGNQEIKKWKHFSKTLNGLSGEEIALVFNVSNIDSLASLAYLDNIKLRAYSNSEYTGTIKDAEGKIVKNATVKIKNKQGKILWQGKTNNKGKFKATELSGSTIKRRFHISKNGQTYKFTRRVKWGKAYNKEFILE